MPGFRNLAFSLACAAIAASASLPARSYFEARRDPRLPPALAIQAHLEEVEHHLRAYPPEGLGAAEAAARARRLEELRAYRLRGDFPQNLDFPDRVIPYFIDARGIACAVGHLMLLSGGAELAREIARTRNHAYIPELDDPRLADWAHRNGLTLEECVRIQPAYAPRDKDIAAMAVDSRGRPWVLTGSGASSSFLKLSYLESRTWLPSSSVHLAYYPRLCMVGDRPLMLTQDGKISWNGLPAIAPEGGPILDATCATTRDSASFWLGGRGGLRRYTVTATGTPQLADTLPDGVLAGDTVVGIAHSENRIWVGTPNGLSSRADSGGAWSRHGLGATQGERLGGLSAGITRGTGAWFGLLKSDTHSGTFPPFSEAGLGWEDGRESVRRYHRGNSPLPGDTVWFAAAGPSNTVFLTCDRKKLLFFMPPDRIQVFPFTLPTSISSFACDLRVMLHIGTFAPGMGGSSASGLYRVEGDRIISLGYPTEANTLGAPERPDAGGSIGWRRLLGPGGDGLTRLDLLGRRPNASN